MGHGAEGMKYRFQWNYPILFSPHDTSPMGTLYAAGDHLFRSTNEGQSWEMMSPDLTRNDKSKQGPGGGPITKDNTSVEYYDTIFTVAESPVTKGVIWTGSDDGLVQVTRDNGKTWSNVTPKGIPEWIQINSIDASPHDAGAAYVAATMYKSDDFKPYLYKTSDYGKTWKKIDAGIPDGAFTRVIREDPARRGLLYAGTETGMYISFDDGERWQPFQLNLPYVPITDLAVHKREKDLVVATQGRSFWILDDLSVLQQLTDAQRAGAGETTLSKPEDAYRMPGGGGCALPADGDRRREPAERRRRLLLSQVAPRLGRDARIHRPCGQVRPEVHGQGAAAPDAHADRRDGRAARRLDRARLGAGADAARDARGPFGRRVVRVRRKTRRRRGARLDGGGPEPLRLGHALRGGDALPRHDSLGGRHVRGRAPCPARIRSSSRPTARPTRRVSRFRKDPRLQTTPEEFDKQLALLTKIRDKLTETHNAVAQIRDVRRQVDDLLKRINDQPNAKPVVTAGGQLNRKLQAVEEALYQTKNQSSQDPLNYPIRLNNKLAALGGVVGSADAQPTEQSYTLYEELAAQIDAQLRQLNQLMTDDLRSFNALARSSDIPFVIVKPAAPAAGAPPGGGRKRPNRRTERPPAGAEGLRDFGGLGV